MAFSIKKQFIFIALLSTFILSFVPENTIPNISAFIEGVIDGNPEILRGIYVHDLRAYA